MEGGREGERRKRGIGRERGRETGLESYQSRVINL